MRPDRIVAILLENDPPESSSYLKKFKQDLRYIPAYFDDFERGYTTGLLQDYIIHELVGHPMPQSWQIDRFAHKLAKDTRVQIINDCARYREENAQDLEGLQPFKSGHDFYQNRNGGNVNQQYAPKDVWERLRTSAQAMGESRLYQGENGLLYAT